VTPPAGSSIVGSKKVTVEGGAPQVRIVLGLQR